VASTDHRNADVPLAPEKGLLLDFLHRGRASRWGSDARAWDAAAAGRTLARIAPLFGAHGYFPLDARGFEHVPAAPTMLVSNHSGGTTIPDAWGFLFAWYRHFGTARPVHVLVHEMILATDVTGRYFSERGALRASGTAAREAIAGFGRDVLVMPGGDIDTWRPWTRRYQVEFAGRTGYARTALELGVPIVPVAHAGAHSTLFVITDGRAIARVMGLARIARAHVWPVHLSLPWGLAIGPWPHFPLPAKLRYRLGAPIVPRACGGRPTDDDVRELDARVRAAVQSMLDGLARGE